MGFGSSGGGNNAPQQQATPPTLDLQQTSALTQSQIDLLRRNITPLSEAYGSANRSQETLNQLAGLRRLTAPGEELGRALEQETRPKLSRAEQDLAKLQRLKQTTDRKTGQTGYRLGSGRTAEFLSQADYDARVAGLQQSITDYKADLNRARTYDPVTELTTTFAEQYGMRDRFLDDMRSNIGSTAEYNRFQEALGRGVQAQTVDRGAVGESLYQTAMQRAQSQGQLSPEAARDATQAARAGMAARGMATGSAALGAELLNRDRYSRARMAEDLAFAQGVEGQDVARRQFNAGMMDATNRYNVGLLGQSSALADAERTRQLAIQQDMYNFSMGTDPRMMLSGLGTPFANMTSPAASSLTALASTTQPIYSGGSFTPQQMPQMPQFNPIGALAAGGVGAVGGYLLGGPTGALAGFGAGSSIGGQIR